MIKIRQFKSISATQFNQAEDVNQTSFLDIRGTRNKIIFEADLSAVFAGEMVFILGKYSQYES